jgi:hypothetical protein
MVKIRSRQRSGYGRNMVFWLQDLQMPGSSSLPVTPIIRLRADQRLGIGTTENAAISLILVRTHSIATDHAFMDRCRSLRHWRIPETTIVNNIQNARLTGSGFGMQAIPEKAVLLILPVNTFIVLHRKIGPAPFSAIFLRHFHESLKNI